MSVPSFRREVITWRVMAMGGLLSFAGCVAFAAAIALDIATEGRGKLLLACTHTIDDA
jgi:hypothetical protein